MNSMNNTLTRVLFGTLLVLVLINTSNVNAFSDDDSVKMLNRVNQLTTVNIEQVMGNGPRLVVMWSLECPACFEELDAIALLLKKYPQLPITLISTDDDPSRIEEIKEVYAEPMFGNTPRWVYSPNKGQQLRYAIDSSWQGELPRSFYVDKNNARHGHSGLLTQKQLKGIVDLIK